MTDFPQLSICIVNWNGGELLLRCIASIYAAGLALPFEIILVDNQSTDDSLKEVSRQFPDVLILINPENSGFSKGNNLALQICRGEYALLLNPDTVVHPGTLEKMVSFLKTHPAAGICGCCLRHPLTDVVENSARSFPTLFPLFCNLTYLDRVFPGSRFFSHYQMTYLPSPEPGSSPREVDWVTGACLMISGNVMAKIGLLDENIFMYCEDIDWCYRCKQNGWKVFYLPAVVVGHYRGQSSRQRQRGHCELGVWAARQYTRSIIYFYAKHYGWFHTLILRGMLIATGLWKAFLWLLRGCLTLDLSASLQRVRSYLLTIPVAFCRTGWGREEERAESCKEFSGDASA